MYPCVWVRKREFEGWGGEVVMCMGVPRDSHLGTLLKGYCTSHFHYVIN